MKFSEYRGYDALGLANLVKNGEVSAAELLGIAISRQTKVNGEINAVITDMHDIARKAAPKITEGAFQGVPFLLKDLNQDYAGIETSGGSHALKKNVPQVHATIVQRFLDAGLNVFGKTNTPEFGLKGWTENDRFGATRNPWNTAHTPGGSSGGSAAAVAAGIVPMASAGDGGGSIRIPAACCGLFGIKASRGRVPLGPAHAEGWEGAVQDGVVSRSVRDSAAVLDAIRGADLGAPFEIPAPERSFLSEVSRTPKKLRIGFSVASPLGAEVHPEAVAAVHNAVKLLESLGHSVEECETGVDGKAVARNYIRMYFGHAAATLRSVKREFGAKDSDFEIDTRTIAMMGEALSAGEYVDEHLGWNAHNRALAQYFTQYDLYLTPTLANPPIKIGENDPSTIERMAQKAFLALGAGKVLKKIGVVDELAFKSLAKMPFTQLANLTGTPAMNVPLHWTAEGLPLGVQFIAPFGMESRLFNLAGQLELAQPWFDRIAPL